LNALKGFVDWKRLVFPGYQINNKALNQWYSNIINSLFWPQEMLELNDCFYRNIHNFEYIAIFDVDEVIVPQNAYNWSQMLQQIKVQLELYIFLINAF